MRIWSLHPKYLDAKGMVALWRETLLAKKVLEGNTSGYKNHPQLNRFKNADKPLDAVNQYLSEVFYAASDRGYSFDKNKINWNFNPQKLTVTTGQIDFEKEHLQKKLQVRDALKYKELLPVEHPEIHPLFRLVTGKIEVWEVVN